MERWDTNIMKIKEEDIKVGSRYIRVKQGNWIDDSIIGTIIEVIDKEPGIITLKDVNSENILENKKINPKIDASINDIKTYRYNVPYFLDVFIEGKSISIEDIDNILKEKT